MFGRRAQGPREPGGGFTRTVAAFAEAMAPGIGGLPAAERDVRVATRVERLLAGTPSPTARLLRLGVWAFDRLPFPRRFSRLDLERRRIELRRLDRSRNPLHRELLSLMKTLSSLAYASDRSTAAAVGYRRACSVDERDVEAGAVPHLGELRPQGEGEDCDVVVVGSGAGGATAASILAEAGLDVLVLEAGPHVSAASYPEDPLEALAALYRDGGLTIATGRPAIPVPSGRAVGGTTVINSGTCFRAPDSVLRHWSEDLAIDWVADLERHYAAAESILEVTRLDETRIGRNGQLVAEGARVLGASGGPISRNAPGTHQCNSCPQGCPVDAKRAMHLTYLPRAAAAGARIRSQVEVKEIAFEEGRAVGVRCRAADDSAPSGSRSYEVRARRAVISAAGAIGTPELLLRSGVESRELGRNLRVHPAAWIGARFDDPVRGWAGVMQSYYVDEWSDHGLLLEATFTPLAFGAHWLPGVGAAHQRRLAAFDRLASNGVHLSDRSSGRVRLGRDRSARVGYRLTNGDARRLGFGIARAAEIWFAAGASEVYPQVAGLPVLRRGQLAAFEARPPRPADLRLEAFHPMGTARIGGPALGGVCDASGAVVGTERLYAADASLLPTPLGVNPMMTVIAVAQALAERLANRLG